MSEEIKTNEENASISEQLKNVQTEARPAVAAETISGEKKRERKLGDLFTGRRKTSVARVKLTKGSGKITINGKSLEDYFPRKALQVSVKAPLEAIEKLGEYDVMASVKGGGPTGQAEAVLLGIARALDADQPSAHSILRKNGYLTRDQRMVERKKYGLHKARRATQFSKR